MTRHLSRLRKSLTVSILTSLILVSVPAHAEQTVWSCDIEGYNLKALLTQNEPAKPRSCSIVVTRTYRKKVSSRTTWYARNEIGFCQKKFDNKLAELKKDGWECTEPQYVGEIAAPAAEKNTQANAEKPVLQQPTQPAQENTANTPESESKFVRHYSLIPYINFAKYVGEDSLGSKATVVSRSADPGLMLTVGLAATENWEFTALLGAAYTDLKLKSTVDTLENEKQFLGDVSIDAARSLTETLSGVLSVGAEKLLFINRPSAGVLSMEGLIIPEITAGLQWQAYQGESLTWSPTVSAGYLFRTSNDKVDAKEGSVYSAGLQVSRNSGNNPIVGGLYFQQRLQDTSLVKWSQSDVGLWLGWSL